MLVIKLTNILLLVLILVVLMSSTSKEGFWSWSHNKTRLEQALKIVKEEQANQRSDRNMTFWITVFIIIIAMVGFINGTEYGGEPGWSLWPRFLRTRSRSRSRPRSMPNPQDVPS